MENKHTKGNWFFQKYSTDYGVYSDTGNGNDIALVRECKNNEETEANVKLITAAPYLLHALEVISDNFLANINYNQPCSIQEMKAALNIINRAISKIAE